MSYKWPGIPNGDYSFDHGRAVWNRIINFLRRLCEKLDGDLVDASSDRRGLMTAADKAAFDAIPETYETQEHAAATYETQDHAAATYETQDHAADTYETKTHASATYETKGNAITSLSASGTTVTYTKGDGTTGTFETQDHDTIYTHPEYTALTGEPTTNQTPGFGDTVTVSQVKSDDTGHVTAMDDRTITIPATEASQSAHGLMSATDKTKLDGIAAGAEQNWAITANLGDNYVMTNADFTSPGLYYCGSLAGSPSGNAPDNNTGDFYLWRVDNGMRLFAVIVLFSPRIPNMYIGHFWEGVWGGWGKLDVTSCLPLVGGTLSGALTVNAHIYAPFHIWNTLDSGELQIHGGTGWHGGILTLHGKNQTNLKGYFRLIAHDGTNVSTLEGRPDGTFYWKGQPIAVVAAQSIGNTSGYIKFSNDLQFVWGNVGVNSTNGTTVTFAHAFASGTTPRVVFGESPGSVQNIVYNATAYPISATSMTVYQHGTSGREIGLCSFLAIGKGA